MINTLSKKTKKSDLGKKMRESVRALIKNGDLPPGERLNSAGELASIYKISASTVHRVLSELVDEGLLQRINGKGTFVRKQHKVFDHNKIIGLPVHSQHNPFHVMMISEISMQINKAGIKPLLGNAGNEEAFIRRMSNNNVNSMLRFPQSLSNEKKIWNLLNNKQINTVVINDKWFEGGPLSSVRTDMTAAVNELVEHLISLGHRKIALVDETDVCPDFPSQLAFFQSLAKADIKFSTSMLKFFIKDKVRQNDNDIVSDLLENFTAAVFIADFYAIKVLKIFQEREIVAGKDFSIVSIDGIDEAKDFNLTSARQPIEEIVSIALNLLRNPPENPVKINVAPKCIYRNSTGKVKNK